MNPNTGHLVNELTELRRKQGYEELPSGLQREANRALDGQSDVHIDLRRPSPLANWAKKKRRAKIAKASRKRNRR